MSKNLKKTNAEALQEIENKLIAERLQETEKDTGVVAENTEQDTTGAVAVIEKAKGWDDEYESQDIVLDKQATYIFGIRADTLTATQEQKTANNKKTAESIATGRAIINLIKSEWSADDMNTEIDTKKFTARAGKVAKSLDIFAKKSGSERAKTLANDFADLKTAIIENNTYILQRVQEDTKALLENPLEKAKEKAEKKAERERKKAEKTAGQKATADFKNGIIESELA
jgi:hypothetical protein